MDYVGQVIEIGDGGGEVELLQSMGVDMDVVRAARVKQELKGVEKDNRLLHYLWEHRHSSPFEMVKIKFRVKCPIFVARQIMRHRMQNLNEISARYREMGKLFWRPVVWRTNNPAGQNKQSSEAGRNIDKVLCDWLQDQAYRACWASYQALISSGVSREQARSVLPVGLFTEFYTCWDMNNFIKFLALREADDAQEECRDYAGAMNLLARIPFPSIMDQFASRSTTK